VLLDGRDVTEAIREPEISRYASAVSALSAVRRRMVAEQRRLARQRGGVIEGRDIGTVVFPETPHKFFLTASSRVRAERRVRELEERGHPQSFGRVLAEMEARDSSDQARADSPLKTDDTYVVIDSSDRNVDAVVAEMERRVRAAG
jgi:cytidylate kinase